MSTDIKSCRIGDQGKAKSPLAPAGIVEIDGEVFSARAKGPAIDVGTPVVVAAGDIGGLVVQPFRSDVPPESIPRYGQPAFDSFGDRAKAVAAKEAQERLELMEAWRTRAKTLQLQLGLMFAVAAVCLLNPVFVLAELGTAPRIGLGLLSFLGAVAWAICVFRSIEWGILQFDEEFVRLIGLSTCLGLCGSAFGLWSIQSLGTNLGLSLTFVATLAGAALIPLGSSLFLSE